MDKKLFKYFVILLIVLTTKQSVAQLPDLIPYRKGNLWGYSDSNKVVKIEPKYSWVDFFSENNIAITYKKLDEKNGSEIFCLIDSLGKEIFTFDIAYGNYDGYFFLKNTNLPYPYSDSTFVFNAKTKEGQFFQDVSLDEENRFGAFSKGDSIVIITSDNFLRVFKNRPFKYLRGHHYGLITILKIEGEKYLQEIISLRNNNFFICIDSLEKPFVFYYNGEIQYLNSKFKVHEFDNLNNVIIGDVDEFKLFDSAGKQIYKTKYRLRRDYYSKNYYIESVSREPQVPYYPLLYNLINEKGEKVLSGITTDEIRNISHINDSNWVLYRREKSCHFYINNTGDTLFKNCNSKEFKDYGSNFKYVEDNNGVRSVLDSNFNTIFSSKTKFKLTYNNYDWIVIEDSLKNSILFKSGKIIDIPLKGFLNSIKQLIYGHFLIVIDTDSNYSSLIISENGKLLFIDTTSFYCDMDRKSSVNAFSINRYNRVKGKQVLSSSEMLFIDADTINCVSILDKNVSSDMKLYNNPEPSLSFKMYGSLLEIPNVTMISFVLQQNSESISAYIDKYGTVYYDE